MNYPAYEGTSIFLSTFPRRERHIRFMNDVIIYRYFYPRSHVGNDASWLFQRMYCSYFYPRSHVGNDIWQRRRAVRSQGFLSTFPRRERPLAHRRPLGTDIFLSTFPRRERHISMSSVMLLRLFLSTFPRRERPGYRVTKLSGVPFLSTFPRRERRIAAYTPTAWKRYFYPRSHVGNDRRRLPRKIFGKQFLSTFPRRERPSSTS